MCVRLKNIDTILTTKFLLIFDIFATFIQFFSWKFRIGLCVCVWKVLLESTSFQNCVDFSKYFFMCRVLDAEHLFDQPSVPSLLLSGPRFCCLTLAGSTSVRHYCFGCCRMSVSLNLHCRNNRYDYELPSQSFSHNLWLKKVNNAPPTLRCVVRVSFPLL